ncbi:hypothetical protein NEOLEDRAFT_1136880 [Neolentinus lepideus HHB14362 ss-1]|uniref:Uncharacterized protein n=1 Tax=Neolentinus lepideus HHB14362 ss-1 TaxID=1314782 RepID=A0A165R2X0_9AGAM|nr:hypothetical protein NEOLEDRAFT_1136880 [Neolentinus lepideus HHB14362 ss-1]
MGRREAHVVRIDAPLLCLSIYLLQSYLAHIMLRLALVERLLIAEYLRLLSHPTHSCSSLIQLLPSPIAP